MTVTSTEIESKLENIQWQQKTIRSDTVDLKKKDQPELLDIKYTVKGMKSSVVVSDNRLDITEGTLGKMTFSSV